MVCRAIINSSLVWMTRKRRAPLHNVRRYDARRADRAGRGCEGAARSGTCGHARAGESWITRFDLTPGTVVTPGNPLFAIW